MAAAPGPWSYDVASETILDVNDEVIGRGEPVSGPLMAAAPALRAALLALVSACVLGSEPVPEAVRRADLVLSEVDLAEGKA